MRGLGLPDGLVRVATGRHEGVARHLARRNDAVPIRDGRPRGFGMGDREGRGMGDREGRPYAASSPGCSGVGATLAVAHAGLPDGLVRVATGRREGVARHLVRRNDPVPDSGWATARVAGWATARVAPTRASSPGCSGVGATLAVAHAGLPDGLVRVATGRREGVARHLARRNDAVPDSGWATARVAGWATARVAPTRPRRRVVLVSGRPLRSPMPVFPTASFGSPRDAARAWHATSCEGTTPCRIRDGRPRGSRDGRPRGSPLRGRRRRAEHP